MKMKKIKIVTIAIPLIAIISFVGSTVVTSCDSTTYQDIEAGVTNPTYSKNIQSVMSARCTTCHYDGKEFPNLTTYEEVVDATADGELLCRINGSCGAVMPEGGKLPQATINMIQLWADNEFPN